MGKRQLKLDVQFGMHAPNTTTASSRAHRNVETNHIPLFSRLYRAKYTRFWIYLNYITNRGSLLLLNWGGSSAGRASRSQCEGREFDPHPLHQSPKVRGCSALFPSRTNATFAGFCCRLRRRRFAKNPDFGSFSALCALCSPFVRRAAFAQKPVIVVV